MKAGAFTEMGRTVFLLFNLNSIATSKKKKITPAPSSHEPRQAEVKFGFYSKVYICISFH